MGPDPVSTSIVPSEATPISFRLDIIRDFVWKLVLDLWPRQRVLREFGSQSSKYRPAQWEEIHTRPRDLEVRAPMLRSGDRPCPEKLVEDQLIDPDL